VASAGVAAAAAAAAESAPSALPLVDMRFGFPLLLDRYYHRGHTWAKPEEDGTVSVGLDELGKRIFGKPDELEMPQPGKHLHVNGTGWLMKKGQYEVRILSPVEGEVVETGNPLNGFALKVKPANGKFDGRHLLRGEEVIHWLQREMDKLQMALGGSAVAPTLADGGVMLEDLSAVTEAADWDHACGRIFLEP
jgi:glycine cleavage system H lipoate-binding protein